MATEYVCMSAHTHPSFTLQALVLSIVYPHRNMDTNVNGNVLSSLEMREDPAVTGANALYATKTIDKGEILAVVNVVSASLIAQY